MMLLARLSCIACFCFVAAAQVFLGPEYVKPAKVSANASSSHDRVGDIVLGGLFPIHQNSEGRCGRILDLGVQRAEGMVLAIDLVNNDPTLLEDIQLGFEIRDTCTISTKALDESLHYLAVDSFGMGLQISGVVGAAASSVSISVANLFRLFRIPQVSYASTSKQLSDKSRFDYFLRTIPPDLLQARAMAAIVRYFNWTYVSVVSTSGAYGQDGIQSFIQEYTQVDNSSKCTYCIAANIILSLEATQQDYNNALHQLLGPWVSNASVVVMFGQLATAEGLMEAILRRKVTDPSFNTSFLWIASDAWGDSLPPKYYDIVEGFIGLSPDYTLSGTFDTYFTSLNPTTYWNNPWFNEYWEDIFQCSLSQHTDNRTTCNPATQSLLDPAANYRQNSKVTFTMDAVFAFAHAVQDMSTDHCNGSTLCAEILDSNGKIEGSLLRDYLLKVSFPGFSAPLVQFDQYGDQKGGYLIRNLAKSANNSYIVQTIGLWKDDVLNLFNVSHFQWMGQQEGPQSSFCSLPCLFGEYPESIQGQAECCWTCQPCRGTKQVSDGIECSTCPPGFLPNSQLSDCEPIPPNYLHWSHPWAILIMILSFAGCIVTLVVIIIVIVYWKAKVIKASSRELSACILSAIFLCYALPFFYIAAPSAATCAITRFGLGFCFSICFGSLLVKTNRIHRIFNRQQTSPKPPAFISPRSQMVFVGIIVFFQVAIAIIWLVFEKPGSVLIKSDYSVELRCAANVYAGLSVSLAYNGVLLACSTFFAFRTRRVPSDFNETKLINLTCYTMCVIWLAFIPSYFGTANLGEVFTTSFQVLAIVLSAICILSILFMPKVYLLFRNKKRKADVESSNQFQSGKRPSSGENTCQSISSATSTSGNRRKSSMPYAGNVYSDTDSGVMNEDIFFVEERRQSTTTGGPLPPLKEIEHDMDQHGSNSIISLDVSPSHSSGQIQETTSDVNAALESQSSEMVKDGVAIHSSEDCALTDQAQCESEHEDVPKSCMW